MSFDQEEVGARIAVSARQAHNEESFARQIRSALADYNDAELPVVVLVHRLRSALDAEREKSAKLRIWIDAEWNSYKGALISFACVTEDGREFYQEVVLHEPPDPWIVNNVLPHLAGAAVEYEVFQSRLRSFVDGIAGPIEFISDWPEDIEQLCRALIIGPGRSSVYRPLTFRCGMGEFKDAKSALPHHCLHDARSLRDYALLSTNSPVEE